MDIEQEWLNRLLVVGAGLIFALLIAGVLMIFSGGGTPVVVIDAGAREAFEAHLLALDGGRWADARALILDHCITDPDSKGAKAASEDLRRSGHTFTSAFSIEEVWYREDGREALLDLRTPPNLPLPGIATMELVDGEWKVSCS